jgi:hypothetical protein
MLLHIICIHGTLNILSGASNLLYTNSKSEANKKIRLVCIMST